MKTKAVALVLWLVVVAGLWADEPTWTVANMTHERALLPTGQYVSTVQFTMTFSGLAAGQDFYLRLMKGPVPCTEDSSKTKITSQHSGAQVIMVTLITESIPTELERFMVPLLRQTWPVPSAFGQ